MESKHVHDNGSEGRAREVVIKPRRTPTLKTVDKALSILEKFGGDWKQLSLREIAKETKIDKSSVFRIVNTLRSHRFLEYDEKILKFRLGSIFLELSSIVRGASDLLVVARAYLEQLRDLTSESSSLMVIHEGRGVYVDRVEGRQRLRMVSIVGTIEPLHCTGVGKAILAYLPEEAVDGIINKYGLERQTPNTITDRKRLKRELAEIRLRGYSIDDEEAEEGIRCIGAPIFGADRKIIASISIGGPVNRFCGSRMKQNISSVVEAAKGISISIRQSAGGDGHGLGYN